MNILYGLGYCLLIISIIKAIDFQIKKRKGKIVKPFNKTYFLRDNWMDYLINVGISFLVYQFNEDAINSLNYLIDQLNLNWQIPEVDNKMFYFVLIPVVIAIISYKFFRKKVSIPIQNKITKP